MCGLVGVISKHGNGFSKELCEIFDNLLFVDQLRGMDSTGVFLVSNDGTMSLAKEASNSTDFRQQKEYKDLMSQAYRNGAALIGHNRSATKGTVNDANAHPFVVDDRITLVHNGTLWGDHKKLADTEVDSHAIAHVIHENGDDVEKAMQSLSGAYALIWHDFKNQTLNLVRNSQRPLHFIETPSAWIWASEANFLTWIIARYSLHPTEKPSLLTDGALTTYTLKDKRFTVSSNKIDLVKPYSPPANTPSAPYQGSRHPYAGVYEWPDDNGYEDALAVHSADYHAKKEQEKEYSTRRIMDATRNAWAANNPTQARISDIEEELASGIGGHFSWAKFEQITKEKKTGDTFSIICTECTEVSKTNPAMGYFLYGTVEKDPDILVKVHMPASTPDVDLLDWTLNNRRITVSFRSKSWVSYRGDKYKQGQGDGYGIISADTPRIPAEALH